MSRLFRTRNVCLAVAVVAAGLAVFVSTSAGSSSSKASTHRAAAYRVGRSSSTSGGYVYVASKVVSLAGGHSGSGTIKCPAKAPHPIAGQDSSNSGLVVVSSSFRHNNGWFTELTNLGHSSAKTQIGAVCAP